MRLSVILMVMLAGALTGCGENSSDGTEAGRDHLAGRQAASQQADASPGDSPDSAVAAYIESAGSGPGAPDPGVLSRESQEMMKSRRVTQGQMRRLAETYRGCRAEPPRVSDDDTLAVVRYPPDAQRCSPWFLVREDGKWRIDLVTGHRLVRFGQGERWHADPAQLSDNPYAFGFADWTFDANGYPR